MKKILIMAAVAMMTAVSAHAQFPANIKAVLDKCDEKMSNSSGIVLDVTMKMKVLVFSGNGTMKCYMKGDKSFSTMTMKLMGHEMKEESGFDGEQEWEYTTASSKKEKDSLIITKTTAAKKKDFDMKMDYEKTYKTAKMKEKGLYYEISLSDRIDPQAPKKMSLKIAKNNYNLREVVYSEGGAKITMTVTKITHGCSDSWFKLDMNRYKNAVVVRK